MIGKWPEYRGLARAHATWSRLDRAGRRSPCRGMKFAKNRRDFEDINGRKTRKSPPSRCCCARRAASAPAWCAPSNRWSGRSRIYGPPVYVRHEIVHNRYVVESLRAKGAIFVEELDEVPETGAPVIFSAHGVPRSDSRGGGAPQSVRARRHLSAGHQGAPRGRDPSPARPRDRADRPCRPSRGDRHHGPAAAPAASRWSRPWRTRKISRRATPTSSPM